MDNEPILILDDAEINKSVVLAEAIERLKANGVNVEVIEAPTEDKPDSLKLAKELVENFDSSPETTQEWYDRRLFARLNRSRYQPHQGKQECARRVRQMERNRT